MVNKTPKQKTNFERKTKRKNKTKKNLITKIKKNVNEEDQLKITINMIFIRGKNEKINKITKMDNKEDKMKGKDNEKHSIKILQNYEDE